MATTADVELADRSSQLGDETPLASAADSGSSKSEKECLQGSAFCSLVVGFVALLLGIGALAGDGVLYASAKRGALHPAGVDQVIFSASALSPPGFSLLEAVHAGSGEWGHRSRLPFAVSDVGVGVARETADDRKVAYLFGGLREWDGGSAVSNVTMRYDPVFDEVNASLAQMPGPRYRFGVSCVHDRFCVLAGGYEEEGGDPVDTVVVYDVEQDVFVEGPSLSIARGDVASAAVDDAVYVIGGYGVGFDMSTSGRLVERLDIGEGGAMGAWEEVARMPTSRGDCVASAFGDHIYVVGGWNEEDGFLGTVEVFHAHGSGEWDKMAPLRVARGDAAVAWYQGSLLVIGGEVASGIQRPCEWDLSLQCSVNEIPVHTVESTSTPIHHDDAHDHHSQSSSKALWMARAETPMSTFRFPAATLHDHVFVFGGHRAGNTASDQIFSFHDHHRAPLFAHALEHTAEEIKEASETAPE